MCKCLSFLFVFLKIVKIFTGELKIDPKEDNSKCIPLILYALSSIKKTLEKQMLKLLRHTVY